MLTKIISNVTPSGIYYLALFNLLNEIIAFSLRRIVIRVSKINHVIHSHSIPRSFTSLSWLFTFPLDWQILSTTSRRHGANIMVVKSTHVLKPCHQDLVSYVLDHDNYDVDKKVHSIAAAP